MVWNEEELRKGRARMSKVNGRWDWGEIGKTDAIRAVILSRIRKATGDTGVNWEMMEWLATEAPESLFVEIHRKVHLLWKGAVTGKKNLDDLRRSNGEKWLKGDSFFQNFTAAGLNAPSGYRLPTADEWLLAIQSHELELDKEAWYWSGEMGYGDTAKCVSSEGNILYSPICENLRTYYVREMAKRMTVSEIEQVSRHLENRRSEV